jgi:hypothetical protein
MCQNVFEKCKVYRKQYMGKMDIEIKKLDSMRTHRYLGVE